MKHFLLSFLLVLNGLIALHAQSPADTMKVQQTLNRLFAGLSALDQNAIRQTVTPDFLLLEDGQTWNLDTLTSKLGMFRNTDFKRINNLRFVKTEIRGTTAWAAYYNTADISLNGQALHLQWLESAVLIRMGKEWKIRLLHSTRLP